MKTEILSAKEANEQLTARVAHLDEKKRWKECRKLKWRLFSPQLNLWAGLRGLEIVPVTAPEQAVLFDGRDNAESKQSFYKAITGIDWMVELCAS